MKFLFLMSVALWIAYIDKWKSKSDAAVVIMRPPAESHIWDLMPGPRDPWCQWHIACLACKCKSSFPPLIQVLKIENWSSRCRRQVVARCSTASVLDVCTGGRDIGGVRDKRQEPREEGLRHCQPQVHRCPGCCFSSLLLLLGVIGMLQFSLQC